MGGVRVLLLVLGTMLLSCASTLAIARQNAPELSFIAFQTLDGIFRVNPDGSHLRRLSSDEPAYTPMQWSANGRWLIYSSMDIETGTWGLYRTDATGRVRPLVTDLFQSTSPQIDPAGLAAYYAARLTPAAPVQLYRIGINGGNNSLLIGDEDVFYPVPSPAGNRLAFLIFKESNYHLYCTGGEISDRQQVSRRSLTYLQFTWSPDGEWLAFVQAGALHRARCDGSDLTRLHFAPGVDSAPAWSPAGDQIVFTSTGNSPHFLYMVSADSSEVRPLIQEIDVRLIQHPAWSPDGEWLVFSAQDINYNGVIYKVRPDGSDLQHLVTITQVTAYPVWSPVIGLSARLEMGLGLGIILMVATLGFTKR